MSTDDESPQRPSDIPPAPGSGNGHEYVPPPVPEWRTQPLPPAPGPWQVGEEVSGQAPQQRSPYAYPSAPPYETSPYPGQAPPRDGFSIAAFVTGLFGILVVSVVLAIVGLSRTASGRRRGRGFAVAGLVLSVLWAGVIAVTVARLTSPSIAPVPAALPIAQPSASQTVSTPSPTPSPSPSARPSATPSRTTQARPVPARKKYVDDLRTGDCLVTAGLGDSVLKVPVVPCRQPHDAEVVGTTNLTGRWHGEAALRSLGDKTCARLFASYVGIAEESSEYAVGWFGPTADSWKQGDRLVVCTADYGGDSMTESIKGTAT